MKFFLKNILKKLMQKELPKPLGRWNIDYCNKKMNNKIDLSNEDHCGPCGQYAITKIDTSLTPLRIFNAQLVSPSSIIPANKRDVLNEKISKKNQLITIKKS